MCKNYIINIINYNTFLSSIKILIILDLAAVLIWCNDGISIGNSHRLIRQVIDSCMRDWGQEFTEHFGGLSHQIVGEHLSTGKKYIRKRERTRLPTTFPLIELVSMWMSALIREKVCWLGHSQSLSTTSTSQ